MMRKSEIEVNQSYIAKVNGKLTTVRVDRITEFGRSTRYHVRNLTTNRMVTFRSAQKFQSKAKRSLTDKPGSLANKLGVDKTPDSSPHLIVEARAGTGKTTTLVEGLKCVKGLGTEFSPSPQQKAVWDSMELSKGKVESICFVAFNRAIVAELRQRVPESCDAVTMHGMGFKAVTKALGKVNVNQYRVQDIISELTGRDIRELRRNSLEMLKATEKLVGLCKMNLTGSTPKASKQFEDMMLATGTSEEETYAALAAHYDVDLNGNAAEVFELISVVLERCKDVQRDRCIDFNDMIWLPIVLNLPMYQYDLLLVDEAQDLNQCQQQLALRAGRRLILCGDPKQAIYGFAGADAESMPRMQITLEETARGCVVLPLTVTRRCGKAIVAEAQKVVPDFEAFEENMQGSVTRAECKTYHGLVDAGNMILCRVNGPLVSECFKFLKLGRKANIQGRDVGQGLISTIKKLRADNIADLLGKLSDWLHEESGKEAAKRNPNETKLIGLRDRYDCLCCFAEGADTIEGIINRIESVFTDDKVSPGIRLSSIHKAKGLEARRVFLLRPENAGCPHPMAKSKWAKNQEMNLLYVAITRAIEELVYVS